MAGAAILGGFIINQNPVLAEDNGAARAVKVVTRNPHTKLGSFFRTTGLTLTGLWLTTRVSWEFCAWLLTSGVGALPVVYDLTQTCQQQGPVIRERVVLPLLSSADELMQGWRDELEAQWDKLPDPAPHTAVLDMLAEFVQLKVESLVQLAHAQGEQALLPAPVISALEAAIRHALKVAVAQVNARMADMLLETGGSSDEQACIMVPRAQCFALLGQFVEACRSTVRETLRGSVNVRSLARALGW